MSNIHQRVFLLILLLLFAATANASDVFTANDVQRVKMCTEVAISPDGKKIAYTVDVQRDPGDERGSAYRELYLISTETANIIPYITGKVNISKPQFSPDGSTIAFLAKRGNCKVTQVWSISVHGGEAIQITNSQTAVQEFRWHPDGKKIAYVATTPKTTHEQSLVKKGYDFIYYEENLKPRNLYMIDINQSNQEAHQLTSDGTVWNFEFNTAGTAIAAAISEKNLIDHEYMFKRIYLLDLQTKQLTKISANPGKLGNFAFSPDDAKIVYTAASELKDHAVSQVYVMDIAGKNLKNLTIPDFRGHVEWAGWKDKNTVVYHAGEGVWPTLSLVNVNGGQRQIMLHAKETGIVFKPPKCTSDSRHIALIGSSPSIPGDLFYWEKGKQLKRLTHLNPWIESRELGKQEIIRYPARDNVEIEGLVIYPVSYMKGEKLPLVVVVHGGPESHYSHGWLTSYSSPGQVLAGNGYVVFYPNYRASTGYGLKFALAGYEDAAGV